jgi:hypothetical protein
MCSGPHAEESAASDPSYHLEVPKADSFAYAAEIIKEEKAIILDVEERHVLDTFPE